MANAKRQHREPVSRRVAWPENGRPNGGEFRLTWSRLAMIATIVVAIPSVWAIAGHYMNRDEIEKAMTANKTEVEAKMKAHADHDAGREAWTAYGFANSRLDAASTRAEFLDDRIAECEAKQMVLQKLPPVDAALCTRYNAKLKSKQAEVDSFKTEAAKKRTDAEATTKEK